MRSIVIHGVEIPEALIAEEAQNHPGGSVAAARKAAGHALATKALLLHRAVELGIDAAPETDENGREETAEAALVRAVLDREIEITPPSEAECRRVYEARRDRFRTPLLYEASHILIERRSGDAKEDAAAYERASRLALAIRDDRADFSAMARRFSACPSAELSGSLGQLQRGELADEVEQALLALAPGEIAAKPVRSRFGWHVVRLDRRIEGRQVPFEVAEERIRLHLEGQAWTAAAARYVAALARTATEKGIAVTLNEAGAVHSGSACLGDLIGDRSAAERLMPWLEVADPMSAARLRDVATRDGTSPATYVRSVVADFVERATDEHWTRLISAARDAADPSQAALNLIMRSKLETECECGAAPIGRADGRQPDRLDVSRASFA